MARPTINDRPMTSAERKARSRANRQGDLIAQLELTLAGMQDACRMLRKMENNTAAFTLRDIRDTIDHAANHTHAAMVYAKGDTP